MEGEVSPAELASLVQAPFCVSRSGGGNTLLAVLAEGERLNMLAQMELVALPQGRSLHMPGAQLRHVYFPTTAIVALLLSMESGASAQIAIVGREGVVGVPFFSGGACPRCCAIVQSPGLAWRLEATVLDEAFHRTSSVQALLLHYLQALITEIAQTAICNRHHSPEQQLSRLLLLSLDRSPGRELLLTQEMIATMLGVRRESVSTAALRLQQAGFIRYTRGRIVVLDRKGLERRSCECYGVVRAEFERLLPKSRMAD